MPFKWGYNDCILFSAKGYEALTGIDYYSQYLGYSTENGARSRLKENGGFEGIIGQHIGPGHRHILKAKRGDVVLLKIPDLTCGLVDDSGQFVVAPGPQGIKRLPLTKAWRIWSY
jgi:hypothetical protein